MNDLIEFLTSKEIIVVYVVAGIACLLCFIVYLIDKSYYKRLQKQNTRELNKIIEDVNETIKEENTEVLEEKQPMYEQPVITAMVDMPQVIKQEEKVEELAISTDINHNKDINHNVESLVLDSMPEEKVEPVIIQPIVTEEPVIQKIEESPKEELLYTDVEPNREEAQAELLKLTQELEKAEQETKNIDLTYYEEEQEENAIISLEELVKKSKEMYESNEATQYADEGNGPISLEEIEKRIQQAKQETIVEPITVEKEEIEEPQIIKQVPVTEQLILDDFDTISIKEEKQEPVKPAYQANTKFQSSPVISPIFGIERKEAVTEMELENTANYEKLDEEIKKTNEFLASLKELRKNLE